MGYLFAMVIGYFIGARAGSKDLDQLSDSVRAVRESEEFGDLVAAARSHLGHTLRELAGVVDGSNDGAGGLFGSGLLGRSGGAGARGAHAAHATHTAGPGGPGGPGDGERGSSRGHDPLGPGGGDGDESDGDESDGEGGGPGDDLVEQVRTIFGQRS